MDRPTQSLVNFGSDESGQDLVEYALIAGILALASIATMKGLSTSISAALTSMGSRITSAI